MSGTMGMRPALTASERVYEKVSGQALRNRARRPPTRSIRPGRVASV